MSEERWRIEFAEQVARVHGVQLKHLGLTVQAGRLIAFSYLQRVRIQRMHRAYHHKTRGRRP